MCDTDAGAKLYLDTSFDDNDYIKKYGDRFDGARKKMVRVHVHKSSVCASNLIVSASFTLCLVVTVLSSVTHITGTWKRTHSIWIN